MSSNLLVVEQKAHFVSQLKYALAEKSKGFTCMSVIDRKQAMIKLQQFQFDKIITSIKIPRVSDGYLFLGHLLKSFRKKDIIVLTSSSNEEISRSITTLGVDHIYQLDDIQGIISLLHPGLEQKANIAQTASHAQLQTADTENLRAEKIQSALQLAMGPVGNMIYEDATMLQKDPDDMRELLQIITAEIAEQDTIQVFLEKLR